MHELPWRTGMSFQLWSYGVGHSELRMYSKASGVMLLFVDVRLIRLGTSYPDVVLRLAEEREYDEFRDLPFKFQLWLALESPDRTGYIACSGVSAREVTSTNRAEHADGRLVMATNHQESLAGRETPRQPPHELDGAEVLSFALAGPAQRPRGTSTATGFVVARYGDDFHLLHCDDDWNVLARSVHDGRFKAMRQAGSEFEALEFLQPG
ncbi:hypothetical protein SK803_38960 [Lentzea sp. BCCO 10_0856]|uniref:Uncharacterized protein n=1 Tax=Lentzea miocenica TaxID=3095431 RepID=A0ABU4TDE6_9PSEU|nr:hypothetical protein [Lentzea sp. BCCO 10_0856]MDX8036212.1 hypothetical protein [Lentzea sp. BCCO 10_0856]